MDESSFWRSRSFYLALIVCCSIILFSNTLLNKFAFDDGELILENAAVHGVSIKNIAAVFTSVPNHFEYLPVRDISYMIDYSLWELNPVGYHLTNILYYAIVCIVLYLVLERIFKEYLSGYKEAALAATLLFIAHPMHVEVVASPSQRKDLLLGLFFLLSIWFYFKYKDFRSNRDYWFSFVMCILALLSKGTAITLPAMLFVTDMLFKGREAESVKIKLLRVLPFVIVTGIITLVNIIIIGKEGSFVATVYGGLTEKLVLSIRALYLSIKKVLYPYPLTINNPVNFFVSFFNPVTVLSCFGFLALLGVVLYFWKRRPLISYSLIWFVVTLSPALYIAASNYLLYERYLFLPSAGFSMLVIYLLWRMPISSRVVRIGVISAILLVTFSVYAGLVVAHNGVWKDDETLNMAVLKYDPYRLESYAALGKYYFLIGQYTKAFEVFQKAKEINPIIPDPEFYRALWEYQNKEYQKSLERLDRLQRDFGIEYIDVYYLKGLDYERLGDIEKAKMSYKKALRSKFHPYATAYSQGQAREALARLEDNTNSK